MIGTSHKSALACLAIAGIVGVGTVALKPVVAEAAQTRGDVFSLMKGVGTDAPAEPLGSEDVKPCEDEGFAIARSIEDGTFQLAFTPQGGASVIEVQGQDAKSLIEEVLKAIEESGAKLTADQQRKLRERLTERLKRHSMGQEGRVWTMPKVGEPGTFYFDGEHMKRFSEQHAKEMAELHKRLGEHMKGLPGARAYMLDEEQLQKMKELHGEDWQKHFKESQEAMKKAMEELSKNKVHRFTPEQLEKMKAEGRTFNSEEFKKQMEEMHKRLEKDMKVLHLKLENLKKFKESLTPAQKELHKKQGYLKMEDLTREQRELLGITGEGSGDFTFQFDDEKIVIKGKGTTPAKKGVVAA